MSFRMAIFPFLALFMFLPAMAQAEQAFRSDEHGFTLTLPDGWSRVPEDALEAARKEHGDYEQFTHPFVEIFTWKDDPIGDDLVIGVNVGKYREPVKLTREIYDTVADSVLKELKQHQKELGLGTDAYLRVEADPEKAMLMSLYDREDMHRFASYTYMGEMQYVEVNFWFPKGHGQESAVLVCMRTNPLDAPGPLAASPASGDVDREAAFEEGLQKGLETYQSFIDFILSSSSIRWILGGVVLLAVIIGVAYRRKEDRPGDGNYFQD